MNSPGTTKSTTAFPPFDDPNADFIIRSSDGIHFHVHKLLLSLFSSVFEGMFAIPNTAKQEYNDNRPCVSVSDDGHRLGCLLSWCDPRCMRSITSLDDLRTTLEMADKYGMDCIINLVEKTMLSTGTKELMESEPLKLFAIAIRFRLEILAFEAVKKTLQVPLTSRIICHDLKHISAFTLQYLSDYHVRCVRRAHQFINRDDLRWARTRPNGSKFVFVDQRLHGAKIRQFGSKYIASSNHDNQPESLRSQFSDGTAWVGWWDTYMDKVCVLLEQTPYGLVAQTPSILRDTRSVIASGGCDVCKERGYDDLVEFSVLLSGKIDEVVSQVRVELCLRLEVIICYNLTCHLQIPFHIEY